MDQGPGTDDQVLQVDGQSGANADVGSGSASLSSSSNARTGVEEVAPLRNAGTQTQTSTTDLGLQAVASVGEAGNQTRVDIAYSEEGVQSSPDLITAGASATVVATETSVQVAVTVAEVAVQYDAEEFTFEVGTQTECVGALGAWLRFFRVSRRISFLRRLRYNLTNHVREYDNLWTRTN